MHRRSLLRAAPLALAATPLADRWARAQAFPTQPIRLVVPFAAGGPTDIPARLLAEELSKALPQRVVVENRTGAGVVVGTEAVAKSAKDGHTLLYSTIAHSVLKPLFPRLPFDPVADFQPVALIGVVPMVLMVNKDLPVRTLPELVALVRANPGKYDFGSSGNGAALHLSAELFLNRAGLKMNHVPYRGAAAAMPDLLNGTLAMMVDVAASALPYVQRGEVRGLAIGSAARSAIAPELPTFQEGGVADYEAYTWHMVFAPAGTPGPVVDQLNGALNRVVADPAVRRRLADLAIETRSDTTPATAAAFLAAESAKWEPIIRAAGIQAN